MPKRQERGGGFVEHTEPLPKQARGAPIPVMLRVLGGASHTPTPSFRLAAGSCLVGTSPGAHLRLSASTVSRQHCEVELRDDGVLVSDLGSRNGTSYLGRRIESILLAPGSTFSVGGVDIGIEADLPVNELPPSASTELHGLEGRSVAMRRVLAMLERLSRASVSVCFEGESGSGKLRAARALHLASVGPEAPWIVLPCAALATNVLEQELFGTPERPSAFERARGGTLVLRHVEALPSSLQPALLAKLESTSLELGAKAPPSFTSRIVTTCSGRLADAARDGRLHAGLFYRIGMLRLEVPPLRVRPEDIPLLAASLAREVGATPSEATVEALLGRAWPGNVRELRSVLSVHAALGVLPQDGVEQVQLLELALEGFVDPATAYAEQKERLVDRFTAVYLRRLIEHAGGNQSVAAKIAGLDRGYVGKMLARHGLKPSS